MSECPQPQEQSQPQPQPQPQPQEQPLIYAKSMTGHIYEYAVRTVSEFKHRVATDCHLTVEFLHLFDPDTETEPAPTDPLCPTTIYALFMDNTAKPVLLDWITPAYINHSLLIDNPSYLPTEEALVQLPLSTLEYIVMNASYMDRMEPHLHRLTAVGWRRLFTNPHAVPLLERTYSLGIWPPLFSEHAPLFANNTHPDIHHLLQRLLSDPSIPPMRRPDLFWRNVARYQVHAITLLDHPTGPGHLTHLDHLCTNSDAVSYFFPLPLFLSMDDRRIRWNSIILHHEAALSVLPLLMNGRLAPPQISYPYLFLNPHPCLLVFYRTLPIETFYGSWDSLCKHEDPAYLAFIEEHLDQLTPDAWKVLNRNPSPYAIALLRRHPEKIHWSLLCSNPSPEVIPMLEAYLDSFTENGFAPFLSTPMESLLGYSLMGNHVREAYQYRDLWHEYHRPMVNLGALSLHPAALPLLKRRPELIYQNSFTIRPDIYVTPQGNLM